MPKLIIKLPEEKDPVICICFEKLSDAQINQDLPTKFHMDTYQIRLMPVQYGMNIMLISSDNQRLYKNVEYEWNKLSWWIDYTKTRRSFVFCHVFEEAGAQKLVKTEGGKPFVLKVNGYSLVNQDQFTF
jgi:hypothetical protein